MLKKAVAAIVVLSLLTAFLYYSQIGCVWQYFFNIKCPGCGMTRALICLFKLDISGAFSYHYMFWSLPILFLFYLFDGNLFKSNFLNHIILTIIGIGFVVNYVLN